MRDLVKIVGIVAALLSAPAVASNLMEYWASDAGEAKFASSKSAKALALCVAVGFEEAAGHSPYVIEGDGVTYVSVNTGGGLSMINKYSMSAKIEERAGGREVTIKAIKAWDGRAGKVAAGCI